MIELPWESWRAVIDALRAKGLPYMLEHADHIERLLERHGPDEPTVRLSLTDDVFLRSYNWARVQLGILLQVERAIAHQRCSNSQSSTHASQTRAMSASVVRKASTTSRGADVGRRTTAARGRSATTPAKSRSGAGRIQLMRAR